jgi:putative MFS transporter
MSFAILMVYGFNAWVPTLLTEHGYSTKDALGVTAILSIAPVLGALAATPIVDRWERKNNALMIGCVIAAGMMVFAFTGSPLALIISGFIVTALLQTFVANLYAYLPEIVPTSLRGIGAGISNGTGRLAGFGGGFLVAALLGGFGFHAVLIATASFAILSGLTLALFGERTKGRALEDIAPTH